MSTTIMLTIAGILALTGAALLIWVVVAAFLDSTKQGALSLLLPGYALYYGWAKMSHPRHRWIVSGAVVALLAAGAFGFFSTSFEPQMQMAEGVEAPALEEDWDDFDDLDAPLNE